MNMLGKRIAGIMLAAGVALSVFAGTGINSLAYTQTTGKVTSDNVKVRESASTTARQVSSLKNGDSVDIVDEATDASGYVWYKIYVNKSEFGYVRSDLVSKSGASSSTTTTEVKTATQSTASLPETQATAVEQKSASVIADSVNIRKGAGTAYEAVGKVTKGDTVTITGEATGTDSKKWYQVTFGPSSKTGFIRGDLVNISEAAPVENTEVTETTETTETEVTTEEQTTDYSEDTQQTENTGVASEVGDGAYSLVYTPDDSGNNVWYLYDNLGGYRVKVKELIEAAQSADAVNKLKKSNNNLKTICFVLGALAVILAGGVVVLVIKLRDSLYYEDEEEEEYDRYSAKRRPEDNSNRRPLGNASDDRTARKPVERRPADEERPSRRPADDVRPSRRPTSDEERPSRNAEDRTVRPSRRITEDEYDYRPVRRPERKSADSEDVRPSRRNDSEEDERPSRRAFRDRNADEAPSRRPSDNRRSAEPEREAPKRRTRNFVGEDDDFEFEFLDLDDDK